MASKPISFEQDYKKLKCMFGLKPDPTLQQLRNIIPKGHVLDLGVGEGRNALYFAKHGYTVEGVDVSQAGLDKCKERVNQLGVSVKLIVDDIRNYHIEEGKYSLIIACMVLPFFDKSDSKQMIQKIKKGLKKGGFAYIKVFSTEEPSMQYKLGHPDYITQGNNSFYNKEHDTYISYYSKNELLSHFANLKTFYYGDIYDIDRSHGTPHFHGVIAYLGQK